MPAQNATPAGWYPDPEDDARDRWWNGVSWSDQRRARGEAGGWAPPESSAPPVPRPSDVAAAMPRSPIPTAAGAPYLGSGVAATAPYTAASGAPSASNTLATAALITSSVAILVNWILFGLAGIIGGIMSIVALNRARALAATGITPTGRSFAVAGIIIGFGGALLWNLFFILVFAANF